MKDPAPPSFIRSENFYRTLPSSPFCPVGLTFPLPAMPATRKFEKAHNEFQDGSLQDKFMALYKGDILGALILLVP